MVNALPSPLQTSERPAYTLACLQDQELRTNPENSLNSFCRGESKPMFQDTPHSQQLQAVDVSEVWMYRRLSQHVPGYTWPFRHLRCDIVITFMFVPLDQEMSRVGTQS